MTDTTAPDGTQADEPDGTDVTTPADTENPPVDESDTENTDSGDDRQAAKLRKRAQAAEAERDALREQVQALQRQQIDAQVTAAGIKPTAVWATGVELAELTADDGTVDAEAVTAAIERARDELGVTPVGRGGAPVPGAGERPTVAPPNAAQAFAKAFAPRKHGVVG